MESAWRGSGEGQERTGDYMKRPDTEYACILFHPYFRKQK